MKLTIHELHLLESALSIASKFYSDADGELAELAIKIRQMQMEEE